MKKSILFLVFVILLGCSEKNDSDNFSTKTVTYLSDSIRSLCFKSGSYWIYKSDSFAATDCTYVEHIDSGISTIYYYEGGPFEYYNIKFGVISPNGTDSIITTTGATHFLFMNFSFAIEDILPAVLYSVDTLSDWRHCLSKNSNINALTIGQNTFYNVQRSEFLPQMFRYIYNNDSSVFFTDRNIGIIKKIIYVNSHVQEWNLVKWKILK